METLQHFQKIQDIVVPERLFQTLITGSKEIDYTFSEIGGIVPSQVVLVTGNPGSGKTTLCAVVGSKLAQAIPDRPVVFLSYEMSDFQLKLQARKITGFSDLLVSTHEFHAQPNGIAQLFESLDRLNPSLLIVDSLQKMASKMPQGMNSGQIHLVQEFTRWAKATFTPVLLIGHNSKGGDYAGPSFLKHEVDSHLTVWHERESNDRLFAMSKNRFGGNLEQYAFRISGDGVYIGNEWWSRLNDQSSDEALDMVMDFVNTPQEKGLDWSRFQNAATSLIQILNTQHSDLFARDTWIRTPDKIQIKWTGKRACCNPGTGVIHFGRGWFDRIGRDWKRIGYRSEKPYIQEYVSNMEEAALWVVIHEWLHLWCGYQHHTKKMWRRIAAIASTQPQLWSKLQNK